MADRDEKGRFVVGYSGGPGRPRKEQETAYLTALLDALTPEQLASIIKNLAGETGSWRAQHAAAELALHYALGKPVQRVVKQSSGLAEILEQLRDNPSE